MRPLVVQAFYNITVYRKVQQFKPFLVLFSDEEEDSNNDQAENIKPLNAKLDDLQTCNDLVGKHGSALQRAIVELQEVEDNPTLFTKLKFVNEKATLFRITANAMISVSEMKFPFCSYVSGVSPCSTNHSDLRLLKMTRLQTFSVNYIHDDHRPTVHWIQLSVV